MGKGYDCKGLFRLSLADFSNKSINHICGTISDIQVFGILVYVM
jgi:hypothetical protein